MEAINNSKRGLIMKFFEHVTYLTESKKIIEYGFIYDPKMEMYKSSKFGWSKNRIKTFSKDEFDELGDKGYKFENDFKIYSTDDPLDATFFEDKNVAKSFLELASKKYPNSEFEVRTSKHSSSPNHKYIIGSVISASSSTQYIKLVIDEISIRIF